MTRTLCAAFVALTALFVAGGAQAKAPPDGVDICGADGACVHLTWQKAETNWALWSPASSENSVLPSTAAPFLIVRWHWPDQGDKTAFYVPSTGEVRHYDTGLVSWLKLDDPNSLRTLTAGLTPYAVPHVTRVTVGGNAVHDPQSYLGMFGVGQSWVPMTPPRWLRIRFKADAPSPWTDADDYFIGRKGRLLWIDGSFVRIPLQLAQRIRAHRSLAP